MSEQSNIEKNIKYPSWVDLLAILGIFLFVQFITMGIFVVTGLSELATSDMSALQGEALSIAEHNQGKAVLIYSLIAQPLMLMLTIIYRKARGGARSVIRTSMNGFNPTMLLWGVVMLLSLVVVMEPLMLLLPESPMPKGRGIYMILSLVVVAPVFEELLCRGVILEGLRHRWGAWRACVISAILFGVMHFEPQPSVNALVMGFLLGYIYLKTRSIFAPMILHSINNLFAYLFLILGISNLTLIELTGGNTMIYTFIYVSALGAVFLSAIAIARRLYVLTLGERAQREDVVK